MSIQGILALLLALGSLAALLRGALKGSCSSGCGKCAKACPAQALQKKLATTSSESSS